MLLVSVFAYADAPALPAGLEQDIAKPDLPMGLGSDEPSLPSGLDMDGAEPDLPLSLERGVLNLSEGLNGGVIDELLTSRIIVHFWKQVVFWTFG